MISWEQQAVLFPWSKVNQLNNKQIDMHIFTPLYSSLFLIISSIWLMIVIFLLVKKDENGLSMLIS
jgi:hypothetical protein